MSKQSEKVKRWRKRIKQRIIESMGGRCCICKYNKCLNALSLHHLNPSEKEFGLSKSRISCISWSKITNELRKCILVCMNCHAEIHANLIDIPNDIVKFNEQYSILAPPNKSGQHVL